MRGRVVTADRARCAEDFLARPEDSRVAGLAGRQSEVLADPAMLDVALEVARRRVMLDELAVAEDHTIYLVRPQFVEFWQGDAERRHTRVRYRLTDNGWTCERLWP